MPGHLYHAITIGFLATALFRRVEGRTIKQFVSDEFGNLEIHIGLPSSRQNCVAPLIAPQDLSSSSFADDITPAQFSALANPAMDPLIANSDSWQAAEIPSANGFATARGLARLYGALAGDGMINSGRIIRGEAIAEATTERIKGIDAILGIQASWGCGFLRNTDGVYGPNDGTFGHSGWGGSFAFGDPSRKLGLAYIMNRMGTDLINDPRNAALIDAVYASLPS